MSEQPLEPDLANLAESQCLRKPDRVELFNLLY